VLPRKGERAGLPRSVLIALLFAVGWTHCAGAQGKLEANYVATLAGLPIGKAVWLIEVTQDQFTAAASGRTTGLLQVFAGGRGTAVAQGTMDGNRPVPASYAVSIVTDKKASEVRLAMGDGNVKEFKVEPPSSAHPDRVPITEAHRRGVLDPMTAAMMTVSGQGDLLSPEVCKRTLPVFDGRGRFDLALSFKRMDQVKAKGYQGPAVVCNVTYRPVSGHRPSQSAVKYLMKAQDIEVWLAPLAGTRIMVPFRASVPTILGPAVVEATQFVVLAQSARSTPATLKTQ
jgi:hypothetical protein